MRRTRLGLCWLALLAAPLAAAQEGGGWSVLSGSAVGRGHLALLLQAGWPEISLGGQYGYSDKLDLGARFAFAYGQDGSFGVGPGAVPGFRVQATGRYELLRSGAVRLGASFAPGFGIDYLPGLPTPRILLPLGLTVGVAPGGPLTFHAGLELPLYATPGAFGGLTFPILLGGGAEYRVSPNLVATAQVRAGPALELTRAGAPARFALQLLLGLAYRT